MLSFCKLLNRESKRGVIILRLGTGTKRWASNTSMGPCNMSSLHQFRDIFASLTNPSLTTLILRKQRALLQKKRTSDAEIEKTISEIGQAMKNIHISDSNITTLSELLQKCICCPDFRKTFRKATRSPAGDTTEAEDISIPAGINIDAYIRDSKRTRVMATVRGVVKSDLTTTSGLYVYIFNLPLRVSKENILDALVNVGTPSEIFLYDTRGVPIVNAGTRRTAARPREAEEEFRLSSPVNAIVRFDSQTEYEKATRLENKLFGILCKSSDLSIDGNRTMFMEPAERKRNIIISNLPKTMTIDELKNRLEAVIFKSSGLIDPKLIMERSMLDGERVSIEFPTFESAYNILKACRDAPGLIVPGEVVSFTPFRASWSMEDGKYRDSHFSLV